MHKTTTVLIALTTASPVLADGVSPAQAGIETRSATDLSAQTREPPRPRVLIERQPAAWDYPRPGTYSWPGPGAVRQCVDWYQLEYRPSGTVLTPQMRCRWVRG